MPAPHSSTHDESQQTLKSMEEHREAREGKRRAECAAPRPPG